MHSCALETPGEAKEPRMVLNAHRHGIPHPDPARAQQLRDLVRTPVQLGIADRFAAARHDDRGLFGVGLGVD